jgi:hypothetical protein
VATKNHATYLNLHGNPNLPPCTHRLNNTDDVCKGHTTLPDFEAEPGPSSVVCLVWWSC